MTRRHHPPVVPVTWVVVAERGRARIFGFEGSDPGGLQEVETLIHPESAMHESDTVSDRQGYFRGTKDSLEAGEPRTNYQHKMAEVFAAQVVSCLEAGRDEKKFGRLVIISAPAFLGTLRQHLPAPLQRMVDVEVDKDYTGSSIPQLIEHLKKICGG
ncbi:MAG: host attachment protein [Fuerstiella sp.]